MSFPVIYRKACADFLPIGEMEPEPCRRRRSPPPARACGPRSRPSTFARCDIAAIAAGLHAEALDVAVAYAAERTAFGRPILDLQAIQFALADVATDLEASRLLYRQAAERLGTPEGPVAVVVGSSQTGIEDAINTAVALAGKTIRNMDWFEVIETRGHIKDGKIAHYQVTLKIGFTLETQ